MNFGIDTLLNWQTLVFGTAVWIIVMGIRRVLEIAFRKLAGSYYWQELALPILPLLVGTVGALLLVMYPYPGGIKAASARALYGLVCGFFSAKLYRIFKASIDRFQPGDPPTAATASGGDASTSLDK